METDARTHERKNKWFLSLPVASVCFTSKNKNLDLIAKNKTHGYYIFNWLYTTTYRNMFGKVHWLLHETITVKQSMGIYGFLFYLEMILISLIVP